jgi:hypothetical protein
MFMQGSKMVHHVTPVMNAREPRLSLVNSYVRCDVTHPDATKNPLFFFFFFCKNSLIVHRLDTFLHNGDPEHVSRVDFARHKAWRAQAILQSILLLSSCPSAPLILFISPYTVSPFFLSLHCLFSLVIPTTIDSL